MKLPDKKKLGEMLAVMGELYGRQVSAGLVSIYFSDLEPYDMDAIERAFNEHRRDAESGQYFPKPADLIKQITGSTSGRALRAWSYVRESIRRHGYYASIRFDDPAIMTVIEEMGGWMNVCNMDTAHDPFIEKRFIERYLHAQRSPRPGLKHLPGYFELTNQTKGLEEYTPEIVSVRTQENVKELHGIGNVNDK